MRVSAEGRRDKAGGKVAFSGVSNIITGRDVLSEFLRRTRGSGTPMEELSKPVTEGQLMVGMPRFGIAPSIAEHTAHHRGALSVYSRTLGLTPAMPYMETLPA